MPHGSDKSSAKNCKKFAIRCVCLTAVIKYKENDPYKPKYSLKNSSYV